MVGNGAAQPAVKPNGGLGQPEEEPFDPLSLVPPATFRDEVVALFVKRWTNDFERTNARKLKESAKIKSLHRTPFPLVRHPPAPITVCSQYRDHVQIRF